jgi:flagellar biosynthesis protein FlhA
MSLPWMRSNIMPKPVIAADDPVILADRAVTAALTKGDKAAALGHTPVVITAPAVRMHLRRLAERFVPGVVVLSYNELLPGTELETAGVVGA